LFDGQLAWSHVVIIFIIFIMLVEMPQQGEEKEMEEDDTQGHINTNQAIV
jgi:hypothetical protein